MPATPAHTIETLLEALENSRNTRDIRKAAKDVVRQAYQHLFESDFPYDCSDGFAMGTMLAAASDIDAEETAFAIWGPRH